MAGRGVMRATTNLLMFGSSSSDNNEDEPPLPSVTDTMGNANVQGSSPMGPTMQPKEDKLREKMEKEKLEMMEPKQNKWASGAFKRGVALQVAVLALIVFLQLKPAEVSTLAVCAPFTQGPGCVSFGEWLAIVILGAPVPIT
ncbi:unnamed protein product [Ascophyllum nodosum]